MKNTLPNVKMPAWANLNPYILVFAAGLYAGLLLNKA